MSEQHVDAVLPWARPHYAREDNKRRGGAGRYDCSAGQGWSRWNRIGIAQESLRLRLRIVPGDKTSLLKADVETLVSEKKDKILLGRFLSIWFLFFDAKWQLGLGVLIFVDEFDKRLTGEPRDGNVMPFR